MASLLKLVKRFLRGSERVSAEPWTSAKTAASGRGAARLDGPPEEKSTERVERLPASSTMVKERPAAAAALAPIPDVEALLRHPPLLDRVRSRRSEDPESRANDGYQLLEALRDKVGGMLLLTATPMQLHDFELYSMVELVEPGLFNGYGDLAAARSEIAAINGAVAALRSERPTGEELDKAVGLLHRYAAPPEASAALNGNRPERLLAAEWLSRCHRLSQALVRNRKTEVGGFKRRIAHRLEVTPTAPELRLQDDLLEYIRGRYASESPNKRTAVGLVLVAFQKMLCSSSKALAGSLESRARRLQNEFEGEAAPASSDDPELIEEEQRLRALPAEDL